MSVLFVTGTGTDVGKTMVTAAVASVAAAAGQRVTVIKPAQTGVETGAPGDLDAVRRLVPGVAVRELARYRAPLAPESAARLTAGELLTAEQVLAAVRQADAVSDVTAVEGAGGLLVRLGRGGFTLADLARELAAPMLVVTEPGLGTLNVTTLTLEAMRARQLTVAGVVIGCWPREPGLAERSNLADLEVLTARPLAGVLKAGIAAAEDFPAEAAASLGPALGGTFDWSRFRAEHAP